MPRERNPNRDKALELYREHKGKITNREIAEILGENEKVIAVWKGRDQWQSVVQQKKSCTTKRKGGQPGNKNAVTTGEFETLLFDCLKPEERELANSVPSDKEQLLLQEIRLLTVREYRMLKRIEDLQRMDFTVVKKKSGDEFSIEEHATLGQIQSIEDALTRVQSRKQRAIETLHRFGFDDARLELELARVELVSLKNAGPETEMEDDGFLEAINGQAAELWSDADVGD